MTSQHRDLAGPSPESAIFHMRMPTEVLFGEGVARRVGDYAASFGTRVLVVVGESHARTSGLLEATIRSLIAAGATVELLEGVPTNPSTAVVDAGALLARAWRADVIVALGGGSVIDVGKAISVAAVVDRPYRDLLSGLRAGPVDLQRTIPVVAVPTLPGSASETNGTSVIIDADTGRKLSAHDELAAPRVALVDPLLGREAPISLLGPSLVDGLLHAVEAGFSDRASIASDALAEQAVRLITRSLADSVAGAGSPAEADSLATCWWGTILAGHALTLAGSIVTHPLSHAVSARFDVHHGAAVAALESAVIARFAQRLGPRAVRVATWFDAKPKSEEAAVRAVLTRVARACRVAGTERSLSDFGIEASHVEMLVRDARASGSRGLRGLPGGTEPGPEELFQVFDVALATTPTSTAKRLLEVAAAAARDQDPVPKSAASAAAWSPPPRDAVAGSASRTNP